MSDEVDFTPSVISDESISTRTSFQDEQAELSMENNISHLPISFLPPPSHSSSPLLDYSIPLQPSYWPSYSPDSYPAHQQTMHLSEYSSKTPEVEYSLQETYHTTHHSIPCSVLAPESNTTEDITFAEAFTTLSKFGTAGTEEQPGDHNISSESFSSEPDYDPMMSNDQVQDQSLQTFNQLDSGYYHHQYFYPPYSHTTSHTNNTITQCGIEEEIDVTNVSDDFMVATNNNDRLAKLEVTGPNLQEVSAALFDNSEDYQNIQNCAGKQQAGLWRPY